MQAAFAVSETDGPTEKEKERTLKVPLLVLACCIAWCCCKIQCGSSAV